MQRLQQAIPLKSDGLNQPIVVPEEIKKPKRG